MSRRHRTKRNNDFGPPAQWVILRGLTLEDRKAQAAKSRELIAACKEQARRDGCDGCISSSIEMQTRILRDLGDLAPV